MQEQVYQKILVLKEMYLPELNEVYQKIANKLQQVDSLPQQAKSDKYEKLKIFKTMLERVVAFLHVSESDISPGMSKKLPSYEKQIINFINTIRPKSNLPVQIPIISPSSVASSSSKCTIMMDDYWSCYGMEV
ncbi:mediator of RNA polymerase II transcription subunit 15a-like isoform X2 [Prosopis cineraria]|nr:mediator of RNA polymerase II transcription subunit 15a-like isoform X2 [Prosopis cineraria]XP_054780919.1 mediator of RNA polymerase II transcription subunit 15a-like isoform X2 [Prosopis cineraria]